jgi:glyoxylase-like metal-dependent hydrolase (beta-lactamase superfamily II)
MTDADSDADADTQSEAAATISPADLQARVEAGEPVRILDIRNRDEVDQWHVSGPSVTLTQIPHNRFIQAQVTDSVDEFAADVDGEGPIVVVCARGKASAAVADGLRAADHDARNLAGGMEAWARLYQSTEIAAGPATVVQYRRPSSGCLGYLVVDGDAAAVVDPLRTFADRYAADAADRGAEIRWAVDTHVHADHVSGLRAVADHTGATPVMSERAVERGVTFDVETVTDGETRAVGDAELEFVAAPGHTTGMTAVAVGDALLTGDSLFVESVARPDLERGSEGAESFARDLHRTLTERFDRFPDGTTVAPGHYSEATPRADDGSYTASLGALRELPVFEMSADEFVAYVTDDMPPRPANFEEIIAINLGQETADDDTAFELELGPNNCAATPADD